MRAETSCETSPTWQGIFLKQICLEQESPSRPRFSCTPERPDQARPRLASFRAASNAAIKTLGDILCSGNAATPTENVTVPSDFS